ncbi:MAG: patatin-like phospholipase family protein [Acidimicrobiales bacterium]
MTAAFVFSGGASLGSIQVGMAIALEEQGIKPDLVVGTSVGAINASWFAGERSADGLADVWRSLRRNQLFPLRPIAGLRGFLGNTTHFVPNSGVRRLLRKHVHFARLEDAPIPFSVITADARSGEEVVLNGRPEAMPLAEQAGIVKSRRVGNTRLISADTRSPYFDGLSDILVKAFGPPVVIADALMTVSGIEEAYIYGSWAARYSGVAGERPVHDIELLVLGTADRDSL